MFDQVYIVAYEDDVYKEIKANLSKLTSRK